jgi:transforming growth factor-beta-induced protein
MVIPVCRIKKLIRHGNSADHFSLLQSACRQQHNDATTNQQPNTGTMKNMKSILPLSMLAFAFMLNACSDDSTTGSDTQDPSITEIAAVNNQFSTLVGALQTTGLDAVLDGAGEFTVFAPTNDAFAALPEGTLESLSEEQLESILLYHVLGAGVFSGQLDAQQTVETLSGEPIFITAGSGGVIVNGTASVTSADIEARNGVIHVLDGVILPDAYGTIVDNAVKRYFLSALVDAVIQADLVDALLGDGPFTVFAPTDEAFAAISDIAAGLTVEELADVLLYHVIEGEVLSTDLQPSQQVTALNGETLTIEVSGGSASINGSAGITTVDIQGANGVIHVINEVLLPPAN